MKTFNAEFLFSFPTLTEGVMILGGQRIAGFFKTGSGTCQHFVTEVFLQSLPKSNERICLLPKEVLAKILLEGEMSDEIATEEKLENAFSFDCTINFGYIGGKNRKGVFFQKNEFLRDSRNDQEMLDDNCFIMAQLARFGVIRKLKVG